MITKYTTKLIDRITRRIGDRVITKNGKLKNGYVLILGFALGLLVANI